ncbi:MAG: M55 family metallopeptidase [Planctomycetota bacterium]|nr:M55 family metallopeptidase [Planctomycetota bacterium]
MKVYIWADMEGVAGVADWDDPVTDTYFNAETRSRMRELFTGEINAAVKGALAAGAQTVLVRDAHGFANNLSVEELHPEAPAILGRKGLPNPWPDLDETVSAAVIIGAHPMAGTPHGILPHTSYEVNGRRMGDAGLFAAVCGSYDVPVAAASGDHAAVDQLSALMPGPRVAPVKHAYYPYAIRTLQPFKARHLIKSAVEDGLRNLPSAPVLRLDRPYKVKFHAGEGEGDDLASVVLNLLKARGAPYGSQDVEPERSIYLRRLRAAQRAADRDYPE